MARYERTRRLYLEENPLCVGCKKEGRIFAAEEIDHIIPVSRRPDLFWETSNWQGLCVPCHKVKTAEENSKGAGFAEWEQYRRELVG